MKYYLIAGEASGDLHGSNLMKEIKLLDAEADFRFYGGEKMAAEGGTLVKHYGEMAFMGFTEVLLNLRTILRNLRNCRADVAAYQPDVVVLIDFPGFNLKIAEFAKAAGFRVCYYISPKVWAWNQKRVLKIKCVVDKMFCILPFEVDFYKGWGMDVDYVGNPLLDEISQFTKDKDFRAGLGLKNSDKIIALLPGSRKQEIERMLPDMLGVMHAFPDHTFIIAGAPSFPPAYYTQFIKGRPVQIVFNKTYDLLSNAHTALVASGTATLETALFKVPQVVLYRGGSITIAIARLLITIKYISLVNLIADKPVVEELIQQDCHHDNIVRALENISDGHGRIKMIQDYEELAEIMGEPGASKRTAEQILTYVKCEM